MQLILPLKHYDEAGRLKPPVGFWLLLLLICRAYLVFIAALSYRQDSAYLLALFYPLHSYFYWSLALSAPAWVVFVLCGFRDKLWRRGIYWFALLVRPLLVCAIVADFALHLIMARQQYWQFSWLIALTLLLNFTLLLYLYSSKHLALMLRDWRSPQ